MKKTVLILTLFTFVGCMVNHTPTTFYVKNTTDKTLNFKASIIKYSSMGPFEMTLPFCVPPNDSVLARRVSLRKDALPTDWFTKFIIFPSDSISFNDPNNPNNWMKSIDQEGRLVYIFNMTK